MVKGNEGLREWTKPFFKRLYTEDSHWRPMFDGTEFKKLDKHDKPLLDQEFSEVEILKSLMQYPGPNGFNMDFL